MRDCTARAKSISSGRVVTGRVVSRRVGAGGGCPERKGAATRVASPFSSPATPLSRAAPLPPEGGAVCRTNWIGSVRTGPGVARMGPRMLECMVQCHFVAGHILSGFAASSFC